MDKNYVVTKISEGFWTIWDIRVRCFLIEGEERALLVDTGFGHGDLASVVNELTSKPITLVNTHTDWDHTGKNEAFGPAHMHPSGFAEYYSSGKGKFAGFPVAPLWEGDVIDIGGRSFEVIHTPGHTCGSIALLDRANRILIGGDSIVSCHVFMAGPARNFPAYIASMEKLLKLSKDFDVIYSSHYDLKIAPSILPTLIEAANLIFQGEIEGVDPEQNSNHYGECKLYTYKNVSFWGNVDGYGKK